MSDQRRLSQTAGPDLDKKESLNQRERRAAPRFELPIPVSVRQSDGEVARGLIKNISASGVWIENSGFIPEIGSRFSLKLLFLEPSRGIRLRAEVVRYTGSGGFAAKFLSLNPQSESVLRLLLPALADECDDDETVTTWTGELLGRLGPDLHSLLGSLAEENGTNPSDLLKTCTRKGLLKIGDEAVRHPGEPDEEPEE